LIHSPSFFKNTSKLARLDVEKNQVSKFGWLPASLEPAAVLDGSKINFPYTRRILLQLEIQFQCPAQVSQIGTSLPGAIARHHNLEIASPKAQTDSHLSCLQLVLRTNTQVPAFVSVLAVKKRSQFTDSLIGPARARQA
jgi:hypothetical protein